MLELITQKLVAMMVNFAYGIVGGFITLFFMWLGFRLLDKITKFDTSIQLGKDNRAVGIAVAGILIGIGIAFGLVIGLSVN